MYPQAGPDPAPRWGTGPYSTLRHGTTLATCDSEPVQTQGCIQAHGALLVLRVGDMRILQARENSLQYLGEAASACRWMPACTGVAPWPCWSSKPPDARAMTALDLAFQRNNASGMRSNTEEHP